MENMNRGLSLEEKLKSLKFLINSYFDGESKVEDVETIVLMSYDACSELLMKLNDTEWRLATNQDTIIRDVVDGKLLPEECIDFLGLIRRVRNDIAHDIIVLDAEFMYIFGKYYDCFLLWLYVTYQSLFRELMSGRNIQILRTGTYSYTHSYTKALNYTPNSPLPNMTAYEQDALLKTLDGYFADVTKRLESIERGVQEANQKLDDIKEKLSKMNSHFNGMKSLLGYQLDLAENEDEKENLFKVVQM